MILSIFVFYSLRINETKIANFQTNKILKYYVCFSLAVVLRHFVKLIFWFTYIFIFITNYYLLIFVKIHKCKHLTS